VDGERVEGVPERAEALLLEVLREPASALKLAEQDWDLLLRLGRRSGLLGRIVWALEETKTIDRVPPRPLAHLASERILSEKQTHDVRWEVHCIREALRPLGLPLILLKGAAYVLGRLPPAHGRRFGDIDILVPRSSIAEVEALLRGSGWLMRGVNEYDQHYYRKWMHQLPPMTHFRRQTTVDVHHTIVPLTTRLDVDASAMAAQARPIAGEPGLAILAPEDMVLHSATHLFNEGEFDRGLRDLDDLVKLLGHYNEEPDFWSHLMARARSFGLTRPLYYAARYAKGHLGLKLPRDVDQEIATLGPPAPLRAVMDSLFLRALRPHHEACRDALSAPALWMLYVRAHHLRMPLHLLVPHLVRKAVHRRLDK
jgi:hypothetical protein